MEDDLDGKIAQSFHRSSAQVQNILEQNRLLINEISQNQESKIPYNLRRNVGLIRELNNNINRVVDLYAGLSKSMADVASSEEGDSAAAAAGGGGGGGFKSGHKRQRPAV